MNIVFVCQKGELELKALLLAWSLRRSHGCSVRLIAACPDYLDWGEISEATRSAFIDLTVETQSFVPIFGESYPIGNKISAIKLLPNNEPGCFLDSDMLSVSYWNLDSVLAEADCAAKPADMGTWGGNAENWEKVYGLCGLELPSRKVRLTVTDKLSAPYFNAGFVATKESSELSEAWGRFAQILDSEQAALDNKYPWLDQIALPPAMQHVGSWSALSEFYNFPAHLRPLGELAIGVVHYHSPSVLLREPRLRDLFEEALNECAAIRVLANQLQHWKVLVESRLPTKSYNTEKRNFLITGIPRSGTSYLTSVLDSQQDWLVINEPKEIFSNLQSRTDASGIELYYAECRERVLLGQPISNKVKEGKVIEDTALLDRHELYHPAITRADFWLGSKNTLAYIAALENLVKLNWPIIAMVRNPLDTLASWRNTFNHLAEAKVSMLPVANPDFHAWTTQQRQALLEIDLQSDATLRRVLLWRHLVRSLLRHQQRIFLWRYEDLVADQQKYLKKINSILEYPASTKPRPTNIRGRHKDHDVREREMLMDLCAAELSELSYKL